MQITGLPTDTSWQVSTAPFLWSISFLFDRRARLRSCSKIPTEHALFWSWLRQLSAFRSCRRFFSADSFPQCRIVPLDYQATSTLWLVQRRLHISEFVDSCFVLFVPHGRDLPGEALPCVSGRVGSFATKPIWPTLTLCIGSQRLRKAIWTRRRLLRDWTRQRWQRVGLYLQA